MIELLTTISLVTGGLLFVLLLLSIIGGLDLDVDFDFDVDVDAGSLGLLKSVLTFVSIGAWVVRIALLTSASPTLAFVFGIVAGAVAVYLLSALLRFLLRQQAFVNVTEQDALFQPGKVYVKIPAGGYGLANVKVKGRYREFKARTADGSELPTGAPIQVVEITEDGSVIVAPPTE